MQANANEKFDISLFDRSQLAFCIIHVILDGRKEPAAWEYVYLNDALAELEGLTEEMQQGKHFCGAFSGREWKWFLCCCQAAYENVCVEFRNISKNVDRLLHILCFPIKPGYCACVFQDCTSLIYQARMGMGTDVDAFYYDAETNIMYLSPSLRKKYKLHMSYQGILEGFASGHLTENSVEKLKDKMKIFHEKNESIEVELQLLTGEYICLDLYYDHTANGGLFLGYIENITEYKVKQQEKIREEKEQKRLLEDALAQAEHASRAKTTFLSNMSHDIRTPMNAIIGFSAMAARHIDNKERVKDCLEKILSSSNHLLSLINDILDMSRIESGKLKIQTKECNIPEMIHSLLSIIQPQIKAKQLDFYVDTFDIKNEDVYADPLKLNQVFINILSNSIKFTPTGGILLLRIRQKTSAPKGYGAYEFIFKDTGIGMSEQFLKHIFEPFERESSTTKTGIGGTGLGMSITKNIIDMMGGEIEVHSERGKGTEFKINLVLKLQEDKQTEHTIEELKNLRALVVDDDFDTCDSITKMLSQIGMRSEWTTSSRESVYRVRKAVEDGDAFHTCILDWLMPEQNGIETAKKIRKVVGDEMPIIILTAYDWSDLEEEAREAGVTAFCSKPLFMSDLKSALLSANNLRKEEVPEFDWTKEDFGSKRVLVVEDNELNREIARDILEEAGFVVETAGDGSVAVQMVEKSEENHYGLVLMDIQMPVMDGHEATMIIRMMDRKDVESLPIIAMTANAFEEDKETALKCGMDAHIAKPLDIKVLMELLSKFVKK